MSTLERIQSICETNNKNEDFHYTYSNILAAIISENHSIDDFDDSGLLEALEGISENYGDDFTFDFDGAEYRIIHDTAIWNIYVDTIKDIVEDCYSDVINLDKIPDFIAVSIDWEATAHNAYVDGYGHTFSSYDGSEIEVINHYIFRTN